MPFEEPTISSIRGYRPRLATRNPRPSDKQPGGYGSALVAREDPRQLFWTRPFGRSYVHVPWARYDFATDLITTVDEGPQLHGELQDAVIESDGRHAWFLLRYGLSYVDLDRMEQLQVHREGVPDHRHHLLALGEGLLGLSGWSGSTLTVFDTQLGKVVKSLRMPAPALAVAWPDRRVELFAFSAGKAMTLGLPALSVVKRRDIPLGQFPANAGRTAWVVQGPREVDERAPSIRRFRGQRVAEVDLVSGAILRRSPLLDDPNAVIGVDVGGHVVVHHPSGLSVLDPDDLAPVISIAFERQIGRGATVLPGAPGLAMLLDDPSGGPE